jgi:hypothetical protein
MQDLSERMLHQQGEILGFLQLFTELIFLFISFLFSCFLSLPYLFLSINFCLNFTTMLEIISKQFWRIMVCTLSVMVLHIHSFAQINPGKDFDLQGFLNGELTKGKQHIKIPPGRYRVKPTGNRHLLLKDLKNITIEATGVEMICTETVQAINIINCENLKIIGLSVDYDPLPFTQGRIVALSEDKTKLTVDILDGYSMNLRNDKLEIFDEQSGELVTRTYYAVTYSVEESKRRVVFSKKPTAPKEFSFEKVGDIVVFDSYHQRMAPHAVVMDQCNGLTLEDMVVYAGPTFAFFERNCNASKYIGCKVDRRPLANDLIPRAVRRMRSNNADGFHSKSALVGPSYRNCIARYNGDDGFAINGNYHVITETKGNVLTVVGKAGQKPDIQVGDPVELVSYDGTRYPDAVVKSIKKGRALLENEISFLSSQKFLAESGRSKDAANVFLIEINTEVDLPLGSVIGSANRMGNGFEIVNCTAGPNRSRGIIVKASNGKITNNTCINNWGMAIKSSPEHQWLEAGSSNQLEITNNTITGCLDVAIAVYAFGGNGKLAPKGAHNNINVSNNKVAHSLQPAYAVTSTEGLIFLNNTVENPSIKILDPARKQFGRTENPSRPVFLQNNANVQEKNNRYD